MSLSKSGNRQELLWIPERTEKYQQLSVDYPFKTKPDRVWTLYPCTNPDLKPVLPLKPIHGNGAFLEDYIHDWNIRSAKANSKPQFVYASRACDGGVWILLEFIGPRKN
jgi:hypothetical protein